MPLRVSARESLVDGLQAHGRGKLFKCTEVRELLHPTHHTGAHELLSRQSGPGIVQHRNNTPFMAGPTRHPSSFVHESCCLRVQSSRVTFLRALRHIELFTQAPTLPSQTQKSQRGHTGVKPFLTCNVFPSPISSARMLPRP